MAMAFIETMENTKKKTSVLESPCNLKMVHDREKSHWANYTLFDLLAWAMTRIAKRPDLATIDNYFLPLLTLYSKWCYVAAAEKEQRPTMVSITWTDKHVFLGATLPKDNPALLKDGIASKTAIQESRFQRLRGTRSRDSNEQINYNTTHKNNQQLLLGQSYGHCAESNAMLSLLRL